MKHIDATPDNDYPMRILRSYRLDCDALYACGTSTDGRWDQNEFTEMMNNLQKQRAEILDKAIAILEAHLTPAAPDLGNAAAKIKSSPETPKQVS